VRPGNDSPDIARPAIQRRPGVALGIDAPRHRVRVWFGPHKIAEYTAEPALAAQYEAAMRRRFAGLRVTNENLGALDARPA
jgi:hypothetical protein